MDFTRANGSKKNQEQRFLDNGSIKLGQVSNLALIICHILRSDTDWALYFPSMFLDDFSIGVILTLNLFI